MEKLEYWVEQFVDSFTKIGRLSLKGVRKRLCLASEIARDKNTHKPSEYDHFAEFRVCAR